MNYVAQTYSYIDIEPNCQENTLRNTFVSQFQAGIDNDYMED